MRPVRKFPAARNYGGNYGVMRQRLLERIGSYCSYCEAPVTNDTAVEHKVAKAGGTGFPDRADDWVNLLLACQACNSAKGSHPDKNDTRLKPPGFANVMDLWIWPDQREDPNGGHNLVDKTLEMLTYERSARTQQALVAAGWARVPSTKQANGAWYTTPATCVWVVPNTTWLATQPPAMLERVQTTLQGLNLNHHDPWSLKYGDRRVANRTYAWTDAEQCATDLGNLWATFPATTTEPQRLADAGLRLMVRSIRSTALAVGYWSVWYTVLRAALQVTTAPPWQGVSAGTREQLLKWILVEYARGERDPGASQLIFPGTAVNRVPTTFT
jgi:hypothetical protein